jgi:hypothetical protein
MKHYILTKDQRAANNGYTDVVKLVAADLTVTTDDLLQNVELFDLNAGDIVFADTMMELVTAWTPDPSANATVTLSVGRTASGYTDILAASNLINAGTQIAAEVNYTNAAAIEDQQILADATQVYAQFDITDTDGDLATITAGEAWVWLRIFRQADRQMLQL